MSNSKKININTKIGMSLAEVLISIFIFSLVMVGINQLFIRSWQNYKLVMNTNEASVAANRGVSEVVNVLRKMGDGDDGSYPILSASSFDLKFFSDIDKDGVSEKVHYYLSGTNLMVGTSNPSGFPLTYPSGDSESHLVVANVVNTGSQPIFYYYNNQNNSIAAPVTNLLNLKMIEVNLFIDRREGDLNIESYASLRNLSENDTIE